MSKRVALLFIVILTVSSLIVVKAVPASASIPKPSVPEFTVKLADNSYDVPPSTTTTTDPYTGKQTVTTQPSYRVENKTIDITIKNQPFVPPNNLTNLYYDIRVKGHFGENWTDLYSISNNTPQNSLPRQSASENTVISIPQDYPAGGQVDFQVEAVIATAHPFFSSSFGYWSWETSGWSNTQTVTVTGLIFGVETTVILEILVVAIALGVIVGLLVYFKKRNHAKINKHSEIEQSST